MCLSGEQQQSETKEILIQCKMLFVFLGKDCQTLEQDAQSLWKLNSRYLSETEFSEARSNLNYCIAALIQIYCSTASSHWVLFGTPSYWCFYLLSQFKIKVC